MSSKSFLFLVRISGFVGVIILATYYAGLVNIKSIYSFLGIAGVGGIIVTLISGYLANESRKEQNKYQYAQDVLPILLQILEDLETLEQAFIFRGTFCPFIEHRCPTLSYEDGEGLKMSYAQRGHQFQVIGYKIIQNCRRVIFLTPAGYLPKVLKSCENIRTFLCFKENVDLKSRLDIMIGELAAFLSQDGKLSNQKEDLLNWKKHSTSLRQLLDALEQKIQEELPSLVDGKK